MAMGMLAIGASVILWFSLAVRMVEGELVRGRKLVYFPYFSWMMKINIGDVVMKIPHLASPIVGLIYITFSCTIADICFFPFKSNSN